MTPGARPIQHQEDNPGDQSGSGKVELRRITPLRELQLLEIYRAGSEKSHAALCELLDSYQRRIYSICYRLARDPDLARDLTQEALVRVIQGLSGYDGRSKLSTWVIRVAINSCISQLRKAKVRRHQGLETGRSGSAAPSGGSASQATSFEPLLESRREPTPAEGVEQAQERSAVLRAFSSLEEETRAILLLRDIQGLDYQQLAEVFEIPVGTVKSRLFRARAALRRALEKMDE